MEEQQEVERMAKQGQLLAQALAPALQALVPNSSPPPASQAQEIAPARAAEASVPQPALQDQGPTPLHKAYLTSLFGNKISDESSLRQQLADKFPVLEAL